MRKIERKGEEGPVKRIKLGDHSTTASTDAKEKENDKVSLIAKLKKPLNAGAKNVKDKPSVEIDSKKYQTEKRPNQNVRLSMHEKLKDGDESKKGTNKEIAKPLTTSKRNIKTENTKADVENKKKLEKVDQPESKSNIEMNYNKFNDQPKNVVSEFFNESVTARVLESHAELKENNKEDVVEVIKSENFTNEVVINLEEESPLEIKPETITSDAASNLAENAQVEEIRSDNLVHEVNIVKEDLPVIISQNIPDN